jgi:hypothetical protein
MKKSYEKWMRIVINNPWFLRIPFFIICIFLYIYLSNRFDMNGKFLLPGLVFVAYLSIEFYARRITKGKGKNR